MKITAKPFSELDAEKLPDGLVPAVIQDDRTLQVLMLGYMNREAYEKSLAEGRVTFYSRTRRRLWTKGETSGNWLDIVSVAADCDNDTLLIRVIPHGPTCHTGSKTCFGEAVPETEGFIRYLQSVIRGRHAEMPEGSYTSKLFTRGVNKIAQKVGEEAVETVIEAVAKNREAMIYEASDLIYHLLVLLEATGCSIADLEKTCLKNARRNRKDGPERPERQTAPERPAGRETPLPHCTAGAFRSRPRKRSDHIRSGTSMPSRRMPLRMTRATCPASRRRIRRTAGFSSRRIE